MEEEISAELMTLGLEDMSSHFLPRRSSWCWEGRAWSMVQLGRAVRYRMDYILGAYCCLFRNMAVRDPHHISYHYMFLGCLYSAPLRENTKYLGRSTGTPLRPPTTSTRKDRLFAVLKRATPKPKAWDDRKNTWILAYT